MRRPHVTGGRVPVWADGEAVLTSARLSHTLGSERALGWSWGLEVSSQVYHPLGGWLSQTPLVSLDVSPQCISGFSCWDSSLWFCLLRDSLKSPLLSWTVLGGIKSRGEDPGCLHTPHTDFSSCLLSALPHSYFLGSQINHQHPSPCSQENPG